MARPKSNQTSTVITPSKNEEVLTVKEEKTEIIAEKEIETKPVETEKEETVKTVKAKVFNFADDEDVNITSKDRANKLIIAVTGNKIQFDDKGNATVKGKDANYLLNSGLGFNQAK